MSIITGGFGPNQRIVTQGYCGGGGGIPEVYYAIASASINFIENTARIGLFNRISSVVVGIEEATDRLSQLVRSSVALFDIDALAIVRRFLTRVSSISVRVNGTGLRVIKLIRIVTDAFSTASLAKRIFNPLRNAISSYTIIDSTGREVVFIRSIISTMSVVGAAVRRSLFYRIGSATTDVADDVGRFITKLRIASGSDMILAGLSLRLFKALRSPIGRFTLQSETKRLAAFIRIAYNNILENALSSRFLTFPRSVSQTLTLLETALRFRIRTRIAASTLLFEGATKRLYNSIRSTGSSVQNIGDSTRRLAAARLGAVSMILTEIAGRFKIYTRASEMVVSVVDDAGRVINIIRSNVSAIVANDNATRLALFTRGAIAGLVAQSEAWFQETIYKITGMILYGKTAILKLVEKMTKRR